MPITRRVFLEMTGTAALLGSVQAESAESVKPEAIKIEKDVVFGKGGKTDLLCDIYRPPAGFSKRMALIHLHGGGWARGSKNDLNEKLTPITQRGYVSIAVEYRLIGAAKWPAQIEDVKAAIRWTRANAESLAIDPAKIGIVGYSAGGHLALMCAGTPNQPQFEGIGGNAKAGTEIAVCLAYYPATVVAPQSDGTANALLPAGSDAAAHHSASATTYVSKSFPPTILFHGLSDVTIAPENSQQFLKLLREAGVPSELHTFDGVPHEFDRHPEFAQECAQLADFFIDRHLFNPKTYPPFQRSK